MNWIRLASVLAAAGLCSGGPIYTLTDLGTLDGSSAMATAVNDLGQSVGVAMNAAGYLEAIYSTGSGITGLTVNSGATEAQASGINNAGQIVGTQYFGGMTYATVWQNGVATIVAGSSSYGNAINGAGDVAGMLTNNGQGSAFVTENGAVVDLGPLDGGSWSAAYALNDAGQAAGYGMTANGNFRAFVWTPDQGYVVLGTLGGASSYAMAINNSGEVVGSSQTPSGYSHAVVWNGAAMEDLGTLGGASSYACGINGAGNVVGDSFITGNSAVDGFLEEGGVMYDINSLLIDAPGWTITGLYAINDSNQIVGVGIFDGVEHAVLLTDPPPPGAGPLTATPEPAVWIFTLTGLAALTLRRAFFVRRYR